MSDINFNIIYYSPLLVFIIIGIVSVLIGGHHQKLDFSICKLKLMQKDSKRRMVVCFLLMIVLPITIIPLHVFLKKYIIVIQFLVLFFIITFSLSFIAYLLRYILIRKKISLLIENEENFEGM